MATQVQFRGGTTSQHNSFTGAVREVTVDTDKETLVVHDGSTAGGFPLARADGGGVTNFAVGGTLNVTGETTLATHLNLGDGDIIKLGASADLQIQHSSTNSLINDTGTGVLELRTNGDDIRLTGNSGSDFMIKAISNGAVELYHDNSKKLETSANGIEVLNTTAGEEALVRIKASTVGNSAIAFGDTGNINVGKIDYNHADNSFAFDTNSAERLRITSAGNVGINASNPTTPLFINKAVADHTSTAITIQNSQDGGYGGQIIFKSAQTNGSILTSATIGTDGASPWNSTANTDSNLKFSVVGDGTLSEAMRIAPDGTVIIGSTSDTTAKLYVLNNNAENVGFFQSGSNSNQDIRAISTSLNQSAGNTDCQHLRSTTQNVGTFSLNGNGSSTFSSDERLKKNIETTRDGYLEDLAKLRVVKYNWHCHDDSTDKELGLIAQEVQKVFPKLVVEDNVELNGIEKPLALKVSVLPMMLLKALQEANTKITALEARITTLEGA